MKIAAIYDVHGNLPALQAVLGEIKGLGIDLLIAGGDIIAGPMPNEVLAELKRFNQQVETRYIYGNGESEALRALAGEEIGGFSPAADESARWVASTLRAEHIEFLKTWENTVTLDHPILGKTIFCHATPHNNVDVFTKASKPERISTLFATVSADLVVCGHTHMQVTHTLGHLKIINAGSVGMPFGATGAYWLMLDDQVDLKHTAYDLNGAAEVIKASSSPSRESFAAGNVLTAPSEEDALALLASLEERQIKEG